MVRTRRVELPRIFSTTTSTLRVYHSATSARFHFNAFLFFVIVFFSCYFRYDLLMSMKGMDLVLGSSILLRDKIWKVVEKQHVKPGKGGAYLQVVLKSLDGVKLEHRFSSSDVVETVMMERKKCQFSYFEKKSVFLTDLETYEVLEITSDMIPENSMFLLKKFATEDMVVDVEYANDQIYNVVLPANVKVRVEFADPVVKGQTAASSYKNAVLVNEINIGVPAYIASGDEIIVNLYGEKGIEFASRA